MDKIHLDELRTVALFARENHVTPQAVYIAIKKRRLGYQVIRVHGQLFIRAGLHDPRSGAPSIDEVVRADEAARMLGVSPAHIRRLAAAGLVKAWRVGHVVFILKSSLLQFHPRSGRRRSRGE